ncbi:hypothetical protein [Acinetobacter boissieri]|uniref:FimV domain-containing protein n=1 Tax=Acinetobacter boissieri TaxID=1219383 RepID=A0A1G6HWA6_9GAMM|nr:hypothetical protein [Acinetobacter boissieri]SDB98511.1 hypothetical protein SAMN05421733_10778 [Acinetobacter boissieri]
MLIYIIPCIILLAVALFLKKREQANKDDSADNKSRKVKEKPSKVKKETVKTAEVTEKTPVDDVTQITKKQQENFSATFAKIQALIDAKNFSVAEAQINQELNKNPEQHQLYLLLAQVYREQDDEIATKQLIGHLKQLKLFDIVENIENEYAAAQRQKKEEAEKRIALAAATATVATTALNNDEPTTAKENKASEAEHTTQTTKETTQDTQQHVESTINLEEKEPTTHHQVNETISQDDVKNQQNETNSEKDFSALEFYTTDEEHEKSSPTTNEVEHQNHSQPSVSDQTPEKTHEIKTSQTDSVQNHETDLADFEFSANLSNEEVDYTPKPTQAKTQDLDLDFNFNEEHTETKPVVQDSQDGTHLDFVLEPETQTNKPTQHTDETTDTESNRSFNYSTQSRSVGTLESIQLDTMPVFDDSAASHHAQEKPVEKPDTDIPLDFTFEPEVHETVPSITPVPDQIIEESASTDVLLNQFDELKHLDEAKLNIDLATEYVTIGEYERAQQLLSASHIEFSETQKVKVEQLLNKMAS